jgi:hypothetical protein
MATLYKFNGYTLTLQALGRRDRHNHEMVRYIFESPTGERIFEGDDFGASPMHDTESLESAKALLGFLTVRDGDTDSEYFDNYTARQLEFRDSFECESLQLYTLEE